MKYPKLPKTLESIVVNVAATAIATKMIYDVVAPEVKPYVVRRVKEGFDYVSDKIWRYE